MKLEHNTIMSNGGYGVAREGNDKSSPEAITLTNNVVTYNHGKTKNIGSSKDSDDDSKDKHTSDDGKGKKVDADKNDNKNKSDNKNKQENHHSGILSLVFPLAYAANSIVSSQDMAFFSSYLDTTDSGNITTTGVEGAGVIINNDTVAPIVSFSNPDNFLTAQSAYTLNVQLQDSSPINVDVYQNGVKIYNTQNFVFDLPVTLQEGVNVFQAQAVDSAGNVGSGSLNRIVLDTTPPVPVAVSPSQSQTIYTNHLPLSLNVSVGSNEPLSGGTIDNQAAALSADQLLASVQIGINQAGPLQINAQLSDLVENSATFSVNATVVLDTTAPSLSFEITDGIITNKTSYSVPISVTDESPTITKIIVNDVELFQTSATKFDAAIALTNEGLNTIKIQSTDAAGNISSIKEITIIRDTIPPAINNLTPSNNATLTKATVPVSGSSSEKLSSVTVNGQTMTLSSDGLSFSGVLNFTNQGTQDLSVVATDIAGNNSTTTITVQINLTPELHSKWGYEECPINL